MPGPETERVRVALAEDATVRVTTGRADAVSATGLAFDRAVLGVAGAVLTWPVLGPPGLPDAEIHDVGRAQQWLWAVYGETVAGAVDAAGTLHGAEATDEPGTVDGAGAGTVDGAAAETVGATGASDPVAAPVTVPVTAPAVNARAGALAGSAARLALGHWAARWWPASYLDGIPALEPDLLGLELAALTHTCQQLFDDVEDQPDADAAELIDDHRAALGPLLRWWRAAPPGTTTALRLDVVVRLIDDAADGAGLDGEELRALRAALERHGVTGETAAGSTAPGEPPDSISPFDQPTDPASPFDEPAGLSAPVDVGELFARRHHDYALAAGEPLVAGGRVIARGAGTNDWRRYPPGFVDAAENAVTWTASAVGAGRRIEVDVVADVAAPVGGARLAAEVHVNGGPPHRVPLARRDDAWTGRADVHIPEAGPPRIEVGILLPGFDPEPSPTLEPSSRTDRDAVRALARRRLARAEAQPPARRESDEDHEPFLAEIAAAATTAEEDY
ncbi:hypothetical protein [Streptomyces griseoviridis]|uniref:hypothetical protein n=1 Tax=Streptomyces griseoviridis TaxID=45398 RepID=UPI0019D290F3|nr:hypothetical protein [Streptomyces griseoviridis]